jgi:hypothetical protein
VAAAPPNPSIRLLQISASASQFAQQPLVVRKAADRAGETELPPGASSRDDAVADRRRQPPAELRVLCELPRELGGVDGVLSQLRSSSSS